MAREEIDLHMSLLPQKPCGPQKSDIKHQVTADLNNPGNGSIKEISHDHGVRDGQHHEDHHGRGYACHDAIKEIKKAMEFALFANHWHLRKEVKKFPLF